MSSIITVHDVLDKLKANPDKWFFARDLFDTYSSNMSRKLRSIKTHKAVILKKVIDPITHREVSKYKYKK